MSIPVLNYNCFSGHRTENYVVFSSQSFNLLQIVMVSPGTHLVKNHEYQFRTNESQLKKKTVQNWKCFGNQTVSLNTDSKTLHYSILKLKYCPSILKHNKD